MLASRYLVLLVVVTLLIGACVLSACAGGAGSTPNDSVGEVPEQNGLQVGQTAPDFRLKNQQQQTVVLSDYLGTKNVILVFYPLAFTPV